MFKDPDLGRSILYNVDHVDAIADHRFARKHKFDILLSIEYFPRIWHINYSAVEKYAPFLKDRIDKAVALNSELSMFSRVSYHYQLMQIAVARGWTRYDLLGQCGLCAFDRNTPPVLNLEEDLVHATLQKFGLQGKRFITFHSGISGVPTSSLGEGGDPIIAKQHATRNLPVDMLGQALLHIKQRYPDIVLVYIGDKDALPVENVDLNLIGKSSLKESMCLLSKANCHIDNDSGLIHIRHALGKRSVVVWGPTIGAFVGYPEDINLQGMCSGCMWLTNNWEVKCPRGYDSAHCIRDIPISSVVDGVDLVLNNSLN